eukprot:4730343-Pyramimonas_sp.AAC.1
MIDLLPSRLMGMATSYHAFHVPALEADMHGACPIDAPLKKTSNIQGGQESRHQTDKLPKKWRTVSTIAGTTSSLFRDALYND